MSFAKFSNDYLMETFTLVDNVFINEHLPFCDEKQIKVYLYGLYLCSNPTVDNSMQTLCANLDMTQADIISAYKEFEDMGLVQIINEVPLEVKYLSLKRGSQMPKKYKGEKWNDFNEQLQQLFQERQLMPNEYNEYYTFLDSSKLDPNAMLMIVQYCINLKGMSVRYPYILTVARNWVADGVRTIADVEDKLSEFDKQTEQMQALLSALGRKGSADLEEKQMLAKWTRSWGYDFDAVLVAVKTLKGSKSFKKLDDKLDEFYRLSIFTAEQMQDYNAHKEHLNSLAVSVNKTLGVYYASLEHEIEVYIVPWTSKGFDDEALMKIAHTCFLSNVHTLDGMNNVVSKFYSQGLISAKSIDEYLTAQIAQDAVIKKIIEKSGRSRSVSAQDREYYRTWSASWGFGDDVILYAAEQSAGKTYPTPYINQLLSTYKANGAKTLDEVKKIAPQSTAKYVSNFEERAYTKEELNSVVVSIDSLSDDDL